MICLKNKILSLVFLCLVAIPVSYCIYFFVKQQVVRHRMAEALEQSGLHTITTTTDRISWVNFGNEILIDGHLFDVESYKQTGKNLQLTGLYDIEEDDLNNQLNKIEQQRSRQNSGDYVMLISLLFQNFFTHRNPSLVKNFYCTSM